MPDIQKHVEEVIRETLMNTTDGAGSDLNSVFIHQGLGSPWLYVEGNLDVQHLASDVIRAVREALGGE